MKRIFCATVVVLMLIAFALPVFATESGAVEVTETPTVVVTEGQSGTQIPTETETVIETEAVIEPEAVLDGEDASEIVGIIENSDSRAEAILAIINKYGCSQEKAEEILDAFIEIGEKYLGQNELWIGFKNDIQENRNFWIMIITCAVAVVVILSGIFVLLGKTNPTMRKAMFGMADALKISEAQKTENSQALKKILAIIDGIAQKEEIFKELIEEKEEYILQLEESMKSREEQYAKERSSVLFAAAYNLRMMKLICDRTGMPVTDKSMIDLWYCKGIESIKDELCEEDKKKLDSMAAMLDTSGGCEGDE